MFNWLKNLFKTQSTISDEGGVFPFPTAKGQDQSSMAPYKVETPVVGSVKDQVTDAVTAETPKADPKQVKKPAAPKKKPAGGKPAGTRGRKPKAKPTAN